MAERKCPTCNQPTTVDVGLHNFDKLFRWPSFQEMMILFMLCMLLVMAYFYNEETQVCRDTIQGLSDRGLLDVPISEFVYEYENTNNGEVHKMQG